MPRHLLNLVCPSDGETHRHGSHPDGLEPSLCIDFECTTAADAWRHSLFRKFLKMLLINGIRFCWLKGRRFMLFNRIWFIFFASNSPSSHLKTPFRAWYLHRLPNPVVLPGLWNPGTPTSPKEGPNQQNHLKSEVGCTSIEKWGIIVAHGWEMHMLSIYLYLTYIDMYMYMYYMLLISSRTSN